LAEAVSAAVVLTAVSVEILLESEVLPATFGGAAVSPSMARYPETASPPAVLVSEVASVRAVLRGRGADRAWALAGVVSANDVTVVSLGRVAVPDAD
jgi:hypothetical protein